MGWILRDRSCLSRSGQPSYPAARPGNRRPTRPRTKQSAELPGAEAPPPPVEETTAAAAGTPHLDEDLDPRRRLPSLREPDS